MNTNKRADKRLELEKQVLNIANYLGCNGSELWSEISKSVADYTDALVAEAEQEGRKRLAGLAKKHEKPAGYFKRDTPVMMVSTLEWTATLPLGEEAK